MPESSQSSKRWLLPCLKLLIVALVVWGISRSFDQAAKDVQQIEQSLGRPIDWLAFDWRWLLVSACCYLLGMLPMGIFWYATMRSLKQRPTLGRALAAFYSGHLGKYVPGKALVVVIRTGMVAGPQVAKTVAAVAVFIETLTMMAAGAFVAAVLLLFQWRGNGWMILLAVGLLLMAGLPIAPPIFRRIVKMLKVSRAHPEIDHLLHGLNWRLIIGGFFGDVVGWLFMGLSLVALMQGIPLPVEPEPTLARFPELLAATSLAMVAGFVTPIPGGLGVREWVLNSLMVGTFGQAISWTAAVALRVIWLLSEFAVSIILYIAIRLGEKGSHERKARVGTVDAASDSDIR